MADARIAVARFLNERSPQVRRMLLSVLVAGVPAFFLRGMADPINVPKLSLLIFGVVAVAVLRVAEILQGSSAQGLKPLAVPAACFAVPLGMSWALSPYRSWALMGMYPRIQGLVPYLLMIVLGILVADAFSGRSGELALAFGWGAALVGGYTIVQAIGLDPFDWALAGAADYATSTTGNSNFTGGFLAISLPVLLALVLNDPGRRRIALRLLAIACIGWVLARSQGAWAAGVAGSAVVLGFHFRKRSRWAVRAGFAVAGGAGCLVVGVVLGSALFADRLSIPTTFLVRARWWEAAWKMGLSHPFFGRGPSSFAIEGIRHRPLQDGLEFGFNFANDPHSVPLALFANLGALGLIGFLGIFVWATWRLASGPLSMSSVAFFGALIAYFVQASVSIDEPTLRVAFWVAVAGLAASQQPRVNEPAGSSGNRSRKKRKRAVPPLRRTPLVLALVLPVLLAAFVSTRLVLADIRMRSAVGNLEEGDVAAASGLYESALSMRDSADYQGMFALNLKERAIDEPGPDEETETSVDVALARQAHRAFSFIEEIPYVFSIVSDARVLQAIADAETPSAGSPEAVSLYRKAFGYDPTNPAIRIELALAVDKAGDPEEALALLTDVSDPDAVAAYYGQYWGALALVAVHAGDEVTAREAIESAIAVGPPDRNVREAQELLGQTE